MYFAKIFFRVSGVFKVAKPIPATYIVNWNHAG